MLTGRRITGAPDTILTFLVQNLYLKGALLILWSAIVTVIIVTILVIIVVTVVILVVIIVVIVVI